MFKQVRPGRNERHFTLYKFRTMSSKRNSEGELLSDELRMTSFGRFLRSTSLDELPELFNILVGHMSLVGPRPLLIKDVLFMTEDQKKRHAVKPGLTGLSQINGRNNLDWNNKLKMDVYYSNNVRFISDIIILLKTILVVLNRGDVSTDGMDTSEDFCDFLLRNNYISLSEYNKKLKTLKK